MECCINWVLMHNLERERILQFFQVFKDVSEALSWGKFDAAVLMVPHDLHEPLTVQCMDAGKHVLLEKPLSHTLDSCLRLVEAAEGASSVVMVGENSAFWPEVGEGNLRHLLGGRWPEVGEGNLRHLLGGRWPEVGEGNLRRLLGGRWPELPLGAHVDSLPLSIIPFGDSKEEHVTTSLHACMLRLMSHGTRCSLWLWTLVFLDSFEMVFSTQPTQVCSQC